MSTLFYFNLAEAFVPDYMHSVLLGVVRKFYFCGATLNTDKNLGPYPKKDEVNQRLTRIKLPSEITACLEAGK